MPENDYLPFGTSGAAPVLSNAAYAGITPANGFAAGLLPKEYINKALRQSSMMTVALANIMTGVGVPAIDDGNPTNLAANLLTALEILFPPAANFTSGQSLTANGYQKFPGGLILQWGTQAVGDYSSGVNDPKNVSFPLTYPNACLFALVGWTDPQATTLEGAIVITSKTTSGFTAQYTEISAGVENMSINWLALGY